MNAVKHETTQENFEEAFNFFQKVGFQRPKVSPAVN